MAQPEHSKTLVSAGPRRPTVRQRDAIMVKFSLSWARSDRGKRHTSLSRPRKQPRILTPDEVGRLFEAAPGPGLKHEAALSIEYGAGLRGCEVVMLSVCDIDSQRML